MGLQLLYESHSLRVMGSCFSVILIYSKILLQAYEAGMLKIIQDLEWFQHIKFHFLNKLLSRIFFFAIIEDPPSAPRQYTCCVQQLQVL